MSDSNIKFALNHMACPRLSPQALVDAATELGMSAVELRNDVRENSIADLTTAKAVGEKAAAQSIEILSINALYPFNIWNEERAAQAETLAELANACGASGLVCCPLNDGDYSASEQEKAEGLRVSLLALKEILEKYNLRGFIEPLGFPISSLRFKQDAVDAICAINAEDRFGLVHDTFHHRGAGESVVFPAMTGLVHVSGVEDPSVSFTDMLDAHRLFVGSADRLDSVGQIKQLLVGGYRGYISFEPFADEIWDLEDPIAAIRESMEYIQQALNV